LNLVLCVLCFPSCLISSPFLSFQTKPSKPSDTISTKFSSAQSHPLYLNTSILSNHPTKTQPSHPHQLHHTPNHHPFGPPAMTLSNDSTFLTYPPFSSSSAFSFASIFAPVFLEKAVPSAVSTPLFPQFLVSLRWCDLSLCWWTVLESCFHNLSLIPYSVDRHFTDCCHRSHRLYRAHPHHRHLSHPQ
jgi:hypothetical protein